MGKICLNCGNPTNSFYALCSTCSKLKADGKITKCSECGKWNSIDKKCECNNEETQKIKMSLPNFPNGIDDEKEDEEPARQCIICGGASGDYLFCKTCFYKYKNKSLLLKITKCADIELLDVSYEGLYVCKDGHVVKSKSEREIDNYLFGEKIAHAYEKALIIEGETFHPDFYLPEKKLYIEHWGYDEKNIEYTKNKNYKLQKYDNAKITLICTNEKHDTKDIDASLELKLSNYEEHKINYLEK